MLIIYTVSVIFFDNALPRSMLGFQMLYLVLVFSWRNSTWTPKTWISNNKRKIQAIILKCLVTRDLFVPVWSWCPMEYFSPPVSAVVCCTRDSQIHFLLYLHLYSQSPVWMQKQIRFCFETLGQALYTRRYECWPALPVWGVWLQHQQLCLLQWNREDSQTWRVPFRLLQSYHSDATKELEIKTNILVQPTGTQFISFI